MQPNTFLVKFDFVCPHCKNANSKLKTVSFTPDFAAKTGTNSIKLVCTHCGVLATRVVVDDLGPASLGPDDFEGNVADLEPTGHLH
jgi:transcription elongation factor Elf1